LLQSPISSGRWSAKRAYASQWFLPGPAAYISHFCLRNVKIMEKVTFELLFDDKDYGKRYYMMSEPIKTNHLGKPRTVQGVVVSDAKTHTERLVFPFDLPHGAILEEFIQKGLRRKVNIKFIQIEGTATSPLGENNESTIEPDENYLNRLIENHYKLSEVAIE
jgi:hypothetical protein